MSNPNHPTDREYFEGRAENHRARAEAVRDKQIASVHLELAAKYDELASLSADTPRLRIVTD